MPKELVEEEFEEDSDYEEIDDNDVELKIEEISNVLNILKNDIKNIKSNEENKLSILNSVSKGIYDELDKLTKKVPAEQITDLALETVNNLITETKELTSNDPYMSRLKNFVPAGDNPQYRDVIMVIRQLRDGLNRFEDQLKSRVKSIENSLIEANLLIYISRNYLKNGETSYKRLNKNHNLTHVRHWFDFSEADDYDIFGEQGEFEIEKFIETNFEEYFSNNG